MKIKHIKICICEACLDGIGSECHTPGCALFLHAVDLPVMPELYEVIAEYDADLLNTHPPEAAGGGEPMSDDIHDCPEFGRRFKCDRDNYDSSTDECFECQFIATKIEAQRLGIELSSTLKRAAGSIVRLGEAAKEASDQIEDWIQQDGPKAVRQKKPKGAVARLAALSAEGIERQADKEMFDGLEGSTLKGE